MYSRKKKSFDYLQEIIANMKHLFWTLQNILPIELDSTMVSREFVDQRKFQSSQGFIACIKQLLAIILELQMVVIMQYQFFKLLELKTFLNNLRYSFFIKMYFKHSKPKKSIFQSSYLHQGSNALIRQT
ncbi:UNKNOWN [Stylonychia lemnae]|uniref:Uncharacterized protein n=1 Tax=Stylonychia lemnae TaxID=5949 RepID=A0A078AMU5_STYLE|nr:UNKNOWN [Stylonychia lemnae]|eukprot:CDW82697.1 UNKNOWN [Stylonychia lemnae]